MAHLAVAPAHAPPQQPVPRGPAESRCHTAFPRGARTAFTTGKQGRGRRGTQTAASVPHPGEALPNPSRSPPFQLHRLLPFVAEPLPGPGGSALPRPHSGPPLRGRARGRQRRRKVKTKKRKITPGPEERSSNKCACSLGRGKPEPRGKTAISLPAEPRCLLRAAEPGAAGLSPAGRAGGVGPNPGGDLRPAGISPL